VPLAAAAAEIARPEVGLDQHLESGLVRVADRPRQAVGLIGVPEAHVRVVHGAHPREVADGDPVSAQLGNGVELPAAGVAAVPAPAAHRVGERDAVHVPPCQRAWREQQHADEKRNPP
jgi:hypothetical protein